MTDRPHEFRIRLADFDRSQLDPAKRSLEGEALRQAIRDHFERIFLPALGTADILVDEEAVSIRWKSRDVPDSLVGQAVAFLAAGDYDRGIVLLEVAVRSDPDDEGALFNLGMALSDRGRPEEAVPHLSRLTRLDPGDSRGWVALGVAHARNGDLPQAVDALRRAVACDPDDGHALKNLGAMLARKGDEPEEAAACLRRAAELLLDDQQVWLNLAMFHEKGGDAEEADAAYLRVLAINPSSQLADMAKEGRSRIAVAGFRRRGARPDATMYCLGALERFDGMTMDEIRTIAFEIATLGMGGIDPNDPAETHALRSIPGKFSGLHLLCIQYVGFKLLDPSIDIGFDLSREYAQAQVLHGAE